MSEVVIVLDRLRSAFNTGNIFRLAEAIGANKVVTCGYTPTPPHPKLAKTAMGADQVVDAEYFPTALDAVTNLKQQGYEVLAIETEDSATCALDYDYKEKVAIVLGNEALGIEEEALKACDAIISLPMFGQKKSINVANCAAVVLYSIRKKFSY